MSTILNEEVEFSPKNTSKSWPLLFFAKLAEGKRVFFWVFLAPFFLGLSILLGFLFPFSGTALFGGVALLGLALTYRWQEKGLSCTYVAFTFLTLYCFKHIPPADRLWQMGIIFSYALEIYIALLGFEETENLLTNLDEENEKKLREIRILKEEGVRTQESTDEKIKALQEELEKWKEEAKHRRIEKNSDEKRLKLAYCEIESLHSQRDEILDEAYQAEKKALGSQSCLEEAQTLLTEKEAEIQRLRQQPAPAIVSQEHNHIESLYKQLKQQFEEKTKVLNSTREQFFKIEGKLIALQKERALEQNGPDAHIGSEELKCLETMLSSSEEKCASLGEEVLNLEELISHILSQ